MPRQIVDEKDIEELRGMGRVDVEFSLLRSPSVRIWIPLTIMPESRQARNENFESPVNQVSDFLGGIGHSLEKNKAIVRVVIRRY